MNLRGLFQDFNPRCGEAERAFGGGGAWRRGVVLGGLDGAGPVFVGGGGCPAGLVRPPLVVFSPSECSKANCFWTWRFYLVRSR